MRHQNTRKTITHMTLAQYFPLTTQAVLAANDIWIFSRVAYDCSQ